MVTLRHKPLGAILQGVTVADGSVSQFRGIPYAIISARFLKAVPIEHLSSPLQCTSYGPRCPQNGVDFRHLLRIPQDTHVQDVAEHEFDCLNLDVTMPTPHAVGRPRNETLPVLVWIHGGSQTVTFGSSASGLCDPTNLVRKSIEMGKPIVVVTLNYRLNIFAFGDCNGERNLALSDQRAAFKWVRQHISGFGGDPEDITLAGESAGAVYVHAHMVMGVPMRQAILQSGSLYLSPPLPESRANDTVSKIEDCLSLRGCSDLSNASVEDILKAQADLGIVSLFLQMEPGLENWRDKLGHAKRLLIGDCEYESSIWRNGIEGMSAQSIDQSFGLLEDESASLKTLYGIILDRPNSCKNGALDLLHDVRFTLATETIVEQWRVAEEKQVFRYLVDEANPWQSSSRAHHTVDLPLLFGSFDLSFNPAACRASAMMSQKWIEFIAGKNPWDASNHYAFGPLGKSTVVNEDEYALRRRKRHCDAIQKIGTDRVDEVWRALATGNMSFDN